MPDSTQTAPAADEVIDLTGVSKRREKGDQIFELRIPRFRIQRGEFIAIVGESGCGKSTLLSLLGLLLTPTSCDRFRYAVRHPQPAVDIDRMDARQLGAIRRRDMGYVLQSGGLLPFLKVRDNIRLPRRINGLAPDSPSVNRICDRLGITGQLPKLPAFLSGGQRQRVAIARALAHEPPLVLADEPTAAVDKLTAREIRDTFKELTSQMGVTVIVVTHDLDLMLPVSDRAFTFALEKPTGSHTLSTCIEQAIR